MILQYLGKNTYFPKVSGRKYDFRNCREKGKKAIFLLPLSPTGVKFFPVSKKLCCSVSTLLWPVFKVQKGLLHLITALCCSCNQES